jgi:hypothetical protein
MNAGREWEDVAFAVGRYLSGASYRAAFFWKRFHSDSSGSRAMKPMRSFSSIAEHQAITSAAGRSHCSTPVEFEQQWLRG